MPNPAANFGLTAADFDRARWCTPLIDPNREFTICLCKYQHTGEFSEVNHLDYEACRPDNAENLLVLTCVLREKIYDGLIM